MSFTMTYHTQTKVSGCTSCTLIHHCYDFPHTTVMRRGTCPSQVARPVAFSAPSGTSVLLPAPRAPTISRIHSSACFGITPIPANSRSSFTFWYRCAGLFAAAIFTTLSVPDHPKGAGVPPSIKTSTNDGSTCGNICIPIRVTVIDPLKPATQACEISSKPAFCSHSSKRG